MSKPSDTPLTDAAAFECISAGGIRRDVVLADRARKLERDRAVLRGALAQALYCLEKAGVLGLLDISEQAQAHAALKQTEDK